MYIHKHTYRKKNFLNVFPLVFVESGSAANCMPISRELLASVVGVGVTGGCCLFWPLAKNSTVAFCSP